MAHRDYAAPLKQERRRSIWASITRGLHLTTDWESAPPLTAGLREQFPDLLRHGTPHQDTPLEQPVEHALQSNHHVTASSSSPRSDSAHGVDSEVPLQNDITQTGRLCGHSTHSRLAPLQEVPRQSGERASAITYEESPAQLPASWSHDSSWNAGLNENLQPKFVSPRTATASQAQQQQNHTVYHRNAFDQLISASQTTHPASRVNSMRRKPVQFSLRNLVVQDDVSESNNLSNLANRADDAIPTILLTGKHGYIPVCSPSPSTEPNTPSQPLSHTAYVGRHRNQAQVLFVSNPGASRCLSSPSPTLLELQADIGTTIRATELEGSLKYNPPSFPAIPLLPRPRFARRPSTTHEGSTISQTTFNGPYVPSRPLGLLQANIVGLKQHVKSGLEGQRSWKDKAVHLGRRIKYHSRPVWDVRDDRARRFYARVDVFVLGPLPYCTCAVCVEKRGEDLITATHAAHTVSLDVRAL